MIWLEPFCATWRPCRGQYSVRPGTPWSNDLHRPPSDLSRKFRYLVNMAVVPDPSDGTTTVIGRLGSLRPLLSRVIAGSFQSVMWLVKIFARVGGDSRRLMTRLPATMMLYGNDVPPPVTGR